MTPSVQTQAQSAIPAWEHVEAQTIESSLTQTEHVLRGGRSHLFLLHAGKGTLQFRDKIIDVVAPVLIWLPQGMVSRFSVSAGTRGTAISIPELQLGISLPTGALGIDIREALLSPVIKKADPDQTSGRLRSLADAIHAELYANAPATQDVVRYTLTLLLIQVWRTITKEISGSSALPKSIFQNFISLVELHVTDHWTVSQYARYIGVSKDRLTSAVQRATGRSPLAEIHRKLMQEAEQQLLSSSQQVSEIAYKLGFKDAAYFNRFFQKNAGMPPGKYRREKQDQQQPRTFAAWP